MRPLAATLALVFLGLGSAPLCGEPTFPYKAYAVDEEVYVRSGPGKNYYPTDKLARGQEVEVHRHDPGGWYAIKPPEGSFTWVSGRYLEKKGKNLAVVTADRVAARVGSQFSEIRDVIQVRLERGEVLEILDEKQLNAGADTGVWYKVAPPSGEFRWVFGRFVDPDFPKDGVRKASAEERVARPVRPAAEVAENSAQAPGTETPEPTATAAADPRLTMTGRTRRRWTPGSITRNGPKPEAASPETTGEAAPVEPTSAAAAPAPAPTGARAEDLAMRRMSPEEFQAELNAIDLQLSVMLAEEPTAWEFGELDTKSQMLLAQAETAVERGRARLLINRLNQAADIKRRTEEINNTQTAIDLNNRQLAQLAERRGAATRPEAAAASQYDGVGRLARVVPSKLGAPQYALMDTQGVVRCYVTAAPGVNLRYYEGRQVGIHGIRGYLSQQNAQHLTAKHITALEDRRLR